MTNVLHDEFIHLNIMTMTLMYDRVNRLVVWKKYIVLFLNNYILTTEVIQYLFW